MFNAEHKNEAGQYKAVFRIDVTNSTNEIQFALFKNGGKIPAKKFHRFEFQVGRIEWVTSRPGYGFTQQGIRVSIVYTLSFFQSDHDKSSRVTFGQFSACYSLRNLHSIQLCGRTRCME